MSSHELAHAPLELHALRDFADRTNVHDSDSGRTTVAGSDIEPPPTRRYQTLLILSGSLMIFHVIGINSVFGIFQVRS
jgi:hypothetical protein